MADGDDIPFRTEYAKSNRSSCKLCTNTISKDSLRMAKMVQSPRFDGKIPNWYHYSCFFKVAKIASMGQVGGLGGIRWDDQQKIREKVEGGGNESTDGPSAQDVEEREDCRVMVDPSGRATCAHCDSKIAKGLLRISKRTFLTGEMVGRGGDWETWTDSWHHVPCFVECLSEWGLIGMVPQQLQWFSGMTKDNQKKLVDAFPTQVAGKKRKGKGDKGSKDSKKAKKEDPEEKALREQTELVWKTRDQLSANLSTPQLKIMLEKNDQHVPSGESRLLDRCCDGMVFGALEPCDTCGGQLVAHTHNYACTGNISEWTKCTVTTTGVKRKKWKIAGDLKTEFPFLKKYKYEKRVRQFPKPPPTTSESSASTSSVSKKLSVQETGKPLSGFTVIILGRLMMTKAAMTSTITELGGKVVTTVKTDTTICISNKQEIDNKSKKMNDVEKNSVPVVDEEFLDDVKGGGALSKISMHTISPWGAPRLTLPGKDEPDFGIPVKGFETIGKKVKMTMKGGAVVDTDSGFESTHHVLQCPVGTLYNAVLGMVDVVRGTNSYYKLQLLESDSGSKYRLFRAWGRVGTTIGGNKVENFGSNKFGAMQEFERLYLEKTGNVWSKSKDFTKVAGKFYPLEIDYGQDDDDMDISIAAGSNSRLPPEIQGLVRMIFDIESMKRALTEFEIDTKKMPLGKLSRRQIQSAYTVLTDLLNEIKGEKNPAKILDGSNRFYTLIPHDFGMQKPTLLETEDMISSKTLMLDSLMEIELAYSLLKSGQEEDKEKDPIDVHFEKLKTKMEVLQKTSEEFENIVDYVKNTHASTHNQYGLEVMDVFKIARDDEDKRYKAFSSLHNRMMLWHGSRLTNFVGILSQGLRIAPPEAPVTGYMFGKGVYFADMVSKSANYCCTSGSNPIGLMLLCEVALGNMYEKTGSEYISKLPPGKHSTKGLGRTAPDPSMYKTTDTGAIIPLGKGTSSTVQHTSLLYNEYIVYDVAQIKMNYLIKMNFKYCW